MEFFSDIKIMYTVYYEFVDILEEMYILSASFVK
jgi:hypothetical protein